MNVLPYFSHCSQPTAPAADSGKDVTLKAMQKFAEKYCEITDTYFCSDLEIAATVVKGKLSDTGLDLLISLYYERGRGCMAGPLEEAK